MSYCILSSCYHLCFYIVNRQSIASIPEIEGTHLHTLTQPCNEPHPLTQPTPPHTLTQPCNEPHTLTQFESLTQPNDLGALVKTVSPRSKLGGVVRGTFDHAYSPGIETDAQPVDWEVISVSPCHYWEVISVSPCHCRVNSQNTLPQQALLRIFEWS